MKIKLLISKNIFNRFYITPKLYKSNRASYTNDIIYSIQWLWWFISIRIIKIK